MSKKLLKVVVMGGERVGKTTLIKQFAQTKLDPKYKPTIGADFFTKDVSVDGNPHTLQLWDTAGVERYRSAGTSLYRGSDVAVFVFDITNKLSFDAIDGLISSTMPHIGESAAIFLVGNKIDLNDSREVSEDQVKEWISKNPKAEYIETSALNSEDSVKLFESIAKKALGAKEDQERQLEDAFLASYRSSNPPKIKEEREENDPSSKPSSSSSSSSSSSVVGKRDSVSLPSKESNQTPDSSMIDKPSLFGGLFSVAFIVCMALVTFSSRD